MQVQQSPRARLTTILTFVGMLLASHVGFTQAPTREYIRLGRRIIAVETSGAANIVVSPAAPIVGPGETVSFTATPASTWSLASGAQGTINPSSGVYTSPASVSTEFTDTVIASANGSTKSVPVIVRPLLVPASLPQFPDEGGTGSINVTRTSSWTATSPVPWVIIISGGSGTAPGPVNFTVDANPTSAARSTTLTIAGVSYPISQAAATGTLTISPTSAQIGSAGGDLSVSVTVTGSVSWTAVPSVPWITILSGGSGTASGSVTYRVAAYSGATPRSGAISIADKSLSVTQLSAVAITPGEQQVAAGGGAATASVTAPAGQAWNASSNVPWIQITGGLSGSGNGTISYTVQPNSSNDPRVGVITVAGGGFTPQSLTVVQAGVPIAVEIRPKNVFDLLPNQRMQFEAFVNGQLNNGRVTWTISANQGGVYPGSIDQNGLYTAPTTVPAGMIVTVRATGSNTSWDEATIAFSTLTLPYGIAISSHTGTTFTGRKTNYLGWINTPGPNDYQASRYAPTEFLFTKNDYTAGTTHSCYLTWDRNIWSQGYVHLANDVSNGWVPAVPSDSHYANSGYFSGPNQVFTILAGNSNVLSNSQCDFLFQDAAGASSSDNPIAVVNEVRYYMGLKFKLPMIPGFNIFMKNTTTAGVVTHPWTKVGDWSLAGPQGPLVTIDAPQEGAALSGSSALVGGWAVDNQYFPDSAVTKVEVFVDGVKRGDATYGGSRPDVCTAINFPNRPGCPNVGFNYLLNTTQLANGGHTLRVVATDADSPANTGKAERQFTVNNPAAVTVTAPVSLLNASQTAQMTATVTGLSNQSVTWTATLGTISTTGLYTAPSNVIAEVTDTIRATSVADNTMSGSFSMVVRPVSVTLTTSATLLGPNQAASLQATATGGTTGAFTWTLTPNVGSLTSQATSTGTNTYTAPATIGTPTNVIVKATSVADPSKDQSVTLQITPTVRSLTSLSAPGTLTSGSSATGTVSLNGAPPGGAVVNLSSSNPSAVSVPTTVAIAETGTGANFSIQAGSVASATSVTITATCSSNCTGSAPTTISVSPSSTSPAIGLSPTSLPFTATAGGSNPASQGISITNTGGGTLSWTATDDMTWLTLSSTSGTGAATVNANVSIAGLTAGSYSGTITVSATGATNTPRTVPVTLIVNPSGGGGSATLVGHWRFDEASEATALDSSPTAANGTIVGTAPRVAGRIGSGALNFNGATHVDLGNPPALRNFTAPSSVSVSAWVRTSVSNYYKSIVSWDSGSWDYYALSMVNGGTTNAVLFSVRTPNALEEVSFNTSIGDGAWHLVTGTYNGSTRVLTIYVDGVLRNSRTLPAGTVMEISGYGDQKAYIGASKDANNAWQYVNASVDDVRIYNGALSDTDVLALFNAGSSTPVIGASPSSLSFTATAGGANPAAQSISLTNTGAGTLTWSASANQPWLSVTPTSGTGAATLNVSAAVGSLAAGTYNGTVTVTATGASNSPLSIPVTFTVSAPPSPTIGLSPASLSFTATAGGSNPASQGISITNTGGGTLNWTATDDMTWLTLSSASGTAPSNLSANVNIGGLTAGSYSGTITISATGATNTPRTVPVTLTINPSGGGGSATLVGHWRFDEASGSTALDSSPTAANGMIVGTAPRVAGRVGSGALDFNGASHVDLGNPPALRNFTAPSSVSVSAWVRTSVGNYYKSIVSWDSGSWDYYALTMINGGPTNAVLFSVRTPTALQEVSFNTAIGDGAWHLVTGTYNGSTRLLAIYVDGVLRNSRTLPAGAVMEIGGYGDQKVYIGASKDANNAWQYLSATVDDVRIYNGALSDTDVLALFNAGGGPPGIPTGLTATRGNGQIALSWNATSSATSYNVKRATASGGPYTTVASGVTATTYTNTGLTNGTAYYFMVSAVNGSGESGNSLEVSNAPFAPFKDDFEPATLSFTSQYTYAAPAGQNTLYNGGLYSVVANPNAVHNYFCAFGDRTTGTGKMMVVNANAPARSIWTKTIPGLVFGHTYTLSLWVASAYHTNPSQLQFRVNGENLTPTKTAPTYGTTQCPATIGSPWEQFVVTFPALANSATVEILSLGTAADGNDLAIDDVELK